MNLTAEMARKWLILFNKKIQEKQDYLSNLDTPIGDGDHGHNMARGMTAVVAALNDNQTLQEVFKATAMALISKVGGASGPLYGTAFMEMAKTAATSDQLSDLLSAGLAGIIKRGGAQVGDKTMVDVWTPIVTEIQKGSLTKIEIEEFVMADGRKLYLLAEGRLVNLAAGDGHPAEIMDLSFGVQFFSALHLLNHGRELTKNVHLMPEKINTKIADIKLKSLGVAIDVLTDEQRAYLNLE